MCFGLPMQVSQAQGLIATCEGGGRREAVSLALTGPLEPGTWVLVHLGSAHRVLEADEAKDIAAAIEAVAAAAEGRDFEHLIRDLADREPELPPHLRAQKT